MKKSTKVVAAMMIAALAVGSLSVYAAETSGQTGKWERPAFSKRMDGPKGWGKNWHKGEQPRWQQLTEEEKAAKLETMKENWKKALDEKLAAGKITQEQYDERLAKIEAGEFGFRSNGRNEAEQPKAWGRNRNKGEKPQRKELTEEEKAAKLETMKENCKKMLDKQLTDGKITQEQYDEWLAKIEAGEFGFRSNGRNHAQQPKAWGRNGSKGEQPQRQQLTEEEKAAKLETMKENCKKMLDKQLADGKITQEQYDEAIAKLESGEFKFPGNGFRGQRNFNGKPFGGNRQGGHRWQGKGFAKNAEQPTAQVET